MVVMWTDLPAGWNSRALRERSEWRWRVELMESRATVLLLLFPLFSSDICLKKKQFFVFINGKLVRRKSKSLFLVREVFNDYRRSQLPWTVRLCSALPEDWGQTLERSGDVRTRGGAITHAHTCAHWMATLK